MAQLTRTDGRKIRKRREDLRMTIAQVVAKLAEHGTPRHRDHIYRIETSSKQPSVELLDALEQLLEVERGAFAPDPPKRRRRATAEPVGGGRA
ncbi:helix-turn-helix domain-containing protein [Herbidospora mongoliensis]|uniref:helix-turn-helix domain-containing protein n=1 Tax=Herbidospora mongoliensis TaxID=688067 RepID=UPI000834F11D|nr:helix-turn-helix transcriptional regulator [Herbidospora mongoliensis]